MTDREREQQEIVMTRLRRYAARLSRSFDLPLRVLDPESPRVKRRYGICFDDGTIRIRLRSVESGEILDEALLVDTLCHELAHLKHFDHGEGFWVMYRRIREYARRHGIYRPGQPSRWHFPRHRERDELTQDSAVRVHAPRSGCPAPGTGPDGEPETGPVQLELFP